MNEYGLQAMTHWRTWLPERYGQIDDPEAFFTALGEQMMAQVGQISEDLELANAQRLAGMGYLERVGLMNNLRSQAIELVREEAMPAPPDPEETESGAGSRGEQVVALVDQWMDEEGMPLDHDHRLWAMLEDDSVPVADFSAAYRAWTAGLWEQAEAQIARAISGEGSSTSA